LPASESRAYDFVVSYLIRIKPCYIHRLFDEPLRYVGMYGVWLWGRGEWTCHIVDDRTYRNCPAHLWDLVLQKAAIKHLGSLRSFQGCSLEDMFALLTGSSHFPIQVGSDRDKNEVISDILRWIGDDRVICAKENTSKVERFYLVEGT
jgi:hypothetical protein